MLVKQINEAIHVETQSHQDHVPHVKMKCYNV